MLDVTSAKLTAAPGQSGWVQVHEFTPAEPEKLEARGHLWAVVATKKVEEASIDTISAGREIISRLHEEYFGDLTAKPFNALRSATDKVLTEFKESWGGVEISACALVGLGLMTSRSSAYRISGDRLRPRHSRSRK